MLPGRAGSCAVGVCVASSHLPQTITWLLAVPRQVASLGPRCVWTGGSTDWSMVDCHKLG